MSCLYNAGCGSSIVIVVVLDFVEVHKAILWIMPVRNGKVVVEVWRDVRLAAAVRLQDGHKDKLLRRDLNRRAGKDAARAQQLEGLDLDGVRGAVEVPGYDKVGNVWPGAACL